MILSRPVVPLPEWSGLARSEIGGKAAGIARLRDAGCPVPDAFCVTAGACPRDRAGRGAPPGPALREAIAAAWRALGAERVAVRSSATLEDLPGGAFAGMHDTVLDVRSLEDVLDAIRRCWASLDAPRAVAYRAALGVDRREAAMAVIVQAFVAADVAGVLFTADPLAPAAGRIVIEAARGGGEAVVRGIRAPDRIVLDREGRVVETTTADPGAERPCLEERHARDLARAALALEARLGAPQDVEWAICGGRAWYLQARPVTALPTGDLEAPRDPTQVWSNVNAGEVMPDVVSPLTWSLMLGIEQLIRRILRHAGIDTADHAICGRLGGRVYFNLGTLVAVARCVPFAERLGLDRAFGGHHDGGWSGSSIPEASIPRLRGGRGRVVASLPALALRMLAYRPGRAPGFVEALARRRRARAAELEGRAATERDLAHAALAVIDALVLDDAIFLVPGAGASWFVALDLLCRRLFRGDDAVAANALLAGLGGVDSAEAGLALWRLAALARDHGGVAAVARSATTFAEVETRLADIEGGDRFLEAWARFVEAHGHHARGEIELANPRWSERPDELLAAVHGCLEAMETHDALAAYRARAEERVRLTASCRKRLRNPLVRAVFTAVLRRAQLGAAARENMKSESVRHLALARSLLLRAGERLADRGIFRERDDVFFLVRDELVALVEGRATFLPSAVVAARRRAFERDRLRTPPAVIGGAAAAAARDGDPDVLRGLAVSPGVARGRARVFLRADDGSAVRAGEILVAPFTDPGWTPLFLPAAGIVTDLGGLLSHGSIVAREYGIPAVVNVGAATRLIRTGDEIEVDGDRGEVRRLG